MWDLWWAKWYWDRFFSEYFGIRLPVSFHWYPMPIHSSINKDVFSAIDSVLK
jgi:hypothetical protein